MADVFVSYKREDNAIARRIVEGIRESGLTVWWDDGITPRQAWDTEIEQALAEATTVLVLWSPRSVVSEWVRTEAHYGKDHGKLIPALVEPCNLPIAFSLTQTVNLSSWTGDRSDRLWRKLLTWITDLIAAAPGNGPRATDRASSPAANTYRDAVGTLPSGEPIYDGAFISPYTPPGTLLRDGPDMPVLRVVPPGHFLLGASYDDPDRAIYETPQKSIDIPASFAIGVYPVLMAEYSRVMGTPSSVAAPPPPRPRSWYDRFRPPSPPQPQIAAPQEPQPGVPVTRVSFDDAQAYVDRLSPLVQHRYRIPSEAEWEYACRAGSTTRFCCGDTLESADAAFARTAGPVQVGTYAPNKFGLYDMHGNVREWTADLWHDSYDTTPQDGRPAVDGHSAMRVVRGGGWSDKPPLLRSAARMRATPSIRTEFIGFRVARSLA